MIGRSENVLTETVDILRANGLIAGATNDFANVLALFDAASLDTVVFGGMVAPDTKEAMRTQLQAANPGISFVQGLAGIPGVIAAQVAATRAPNGEDADTVTYDGEDRVLELSLESAQAVRVVGFWGTFVPPEPTSTSEVIFDEVLRPGSHTVPLPAWFPSVASFVVVHVGAHVHPFAVGPMPRLDILPPPA